MKSCILHQMMSNEDNFFAVLIQDFLYMDISNIQKNYIR